MSPSSAHFAAPPGTGGAAIFEAHRRSLERLAYRMLADRAAAEDAVQETFIRWHQADRSGIVTPRAWLITACTRICLDELRSARARRETYVGPWLPEPIIEPERPADPVEQDEDLSVAFMLLLDRLKPIDRAVWLLRHVFDLDYDAIGRAVGKTAVACRQIASRAGRNLDGASRLRQPAPETTRAFIAALASGDVPGLVRLLAGDAVLLSDGGGKAIAALNPIRSAGKIARFLFGLRRKSGDLYRFRPVTINGGPGYLLVDDAGRVHSATTFGMADGRIAALYVMRNPDKLRGAASI